MEAWPAPPVPELPGAAPPLRVYDTATGSLRQVPAARPVGGADEEPRPGPARMYVCGITPYDATHLGHAATYVAFDLVNRIWRDAGLAVHYVQNVTDVDDPLLERARRDGEDWRALAERETARFRDDMTALHVLPPDDYVGAVEAIPLIADAVRGLRERGAAYDVDGDVYFAVSSDHRFGAVSGLAPQRMPEVFAERGGDPDRPGKKDPLDPLLWRAASSYREPDEPAWDGPVGPGRPGWHVECTAIALRFLGMGFDVQGGGSDLAFPHHEMGAAHAHALTGQWPFAAAYVHAGMVGLGGEKMSKSKGNLVFLSALRAAGVDPMAVRLALLGAHYRSDWDWTESTLGAAAHRLERWRAAVSRPSGPAADQLLTDVRRHLAADLDAPAAVAAVDQWVAGQERAGGAPPAAPRPRPATGPRRPRSRPWTSGSPARSGPAAPTRPHPAWSAVPSTPCSASGSDPQPAVPTSHRQGGATRRQIPPDARLRPGEVGMWPTSQHFVDEAVDGRKGPWLTCRVRSLW